MSYDEYEVISNNLDEIFLTNNKIKIHLDPKKNFQDDFMFISHAHTDHLLNKTNLKNESLKNKILSSHETIQIANSRGYNLPYNSNSIEGVQLVDSGHILGSRGLLIDNKIFYTGDISIRKRAFLESPKIPKVETLIIESTFGKPEYKFPSYDELKHQVNTLISNMFSKGIPVILMGYSLGKAQILMSFFGNWKPLYVHDDIYKFNKIYSSFGINLEEAIPLSNIKDKNSLNKKPWIMIYPLTNGKNSFITYLKTHFNAVTIGFSGWAIKNNYCSYMNLDYAFPFSDHCDFDDLIQVVKKSKAETIYTIHGFQKDFAKSLNQIGYNAESIKNIKNKKIKKNSTLDDFF